MTKHNYLEMIPVPVGKKHIWAIGGGKGGSGKSLIAANLGIRLARAGHRVTILDFDWGGGNLHTYLGMRAPSNTMADFILRRVSSLSELASDTSVSNLRIICAPQDYYHFAGMFSKLKSKFLRQILALDDDFIILDLGPGSLYSILDLSLISGCSILVTLPEPPAIENSYLLLKRMAHRKIGQIIKPHGMIDLLTKWTIGQNGHKSNSKHIGEFLSYLRGVDGDLGKQVDVALSRLKVKIIVNQVRTREDAQLGNSISYLAKKFIGLDVEYTGFIPFDMNVNLAVKQFQPLMIFYPESNAAKGINSVAKRLTT